MEFDVAIIGGGLAGSALATALRSSQLKVALVETNRPKKTMPPEIDQRVYALSPASQQFLHEIGVWERLDTARLQPVYDMRVFGDRSGSIHFSAYQSGTDVLAWISESSPLQYELWETISRQSNVKIFAPARCEEMQHDAEKAVLRLDTGERLSARLVVAADGAQSWVRGQVGINATFTPYHEKGVVTNFRCSGNHDATAFQWFHRDGIIALLPLANGAVSLVWSAPDATADELMQLNEQAFARRVEEVSEGVVGSLELLTPRAAFPLRLMRVDSVIAERVALIGDAAHAIHPLSGHGINLGFQDARVLAETLCKLARWDDPGSPTVARRYARARAEEPFVVQYTTHALNKLFGRSDLLSTLARNHGMNFTDRLGPVKNALVRFAMHGHF